MKKYADFLLWLLKMTVGCFLFGLGFDLFLEPYGMNSGGISGLAMVLVHLLGYGTVGTLNLLINLPLLVFADEPTGNLDRKNADEVLELLLETKRVIGQTLVMVTHDLSIARRADRILKMDNGVLSPMMPSDLAKWGS